MTGGSNITAIGPENAQDAPESTQEVDGSADPSPEATADQGFVDEADIWDDGDEDPRPNRDWIYASAAALLVLGWTGFFGWTIQADVAAGTASPLQWRDWIIDWSVPVLLVGVIWLIARRNSRREALRFGETAALLAKESSDLEMRLAATNRELSMAREFLGSQSRELDSLGRVASERISKHAKELQSLIKGNGEQVAAIGSTSETALANMVRLRDDLPVIATSARDTTNQIGNAGRTADEQLAKLISGFERLNQFGEASERQVEALNSRVETTLAQFAERLTAIETMTTERFDALTTKSEEYRSELDSREVQALAAMRQRAEDLKSELAELSAELDQQQNASLSDLTTRLATLADEGAKVAQTMRDGESEALSALHESKDRLHDEIAEVVSMIDDLDRKAIEASKTRIIELSKEAGRFDDKLAERDRLFIAEMARRQDAFDTRETQASELLVKRLANLDEAIEERRERQIAETEKLVEHGQTISERLEQLNTLFASISEHGESTQRLLGNGLTDFDQQLAGSRKQLVDTGRTMETLTDAGVRLLEIIQSGARQSREDLAQAIQKTSNQLESVEKRGFMLQETVNRTGERGAQLSNELDEAQSKIDGADRAISDLQSKVAESSDDALAKLNAIKGSLANLVEQTNTLSGETQDTLREAVAQLELATNSAYEAIETGTREKLTTLATTVGSDAVEALERSLRNESAEAIGRLEQSASHASGIGREAASQLRDQLAKVNELTGNLELRVARARELAEEQTNNDFARRMALITDSLNSAAIDVASALSSEVPDTSWDAYLKGDRGIFTRRAVRLLDSGQTREIADLYQNDDSFKETVNRYIHDFESMLRSMLSTRDGNALSVTLLGSDIGKLYVVLAQSIERFRN